MFPFQNNNDWPFQISDFISEEQQIQAQNHNNRTDPTTLVESTNKKSRGGGRGDSCGGCGGGCGGGFSFDDVNCNNNDNETRKTIHREVERQRRQEMSSLFSSLRTIIPPHYIKGKRSTSDHLGEAVNFIKDLEKNVKDLTNKRNQLKETLEWSTPTHKVGGSSNLRPCKGSVVLNPSLGGLRINIEIGYEDEIFSLSSALQVVIEEGLGVSSCTSNKCNDKMIHSIMCEVNEIACIDFIRLQQRLIDLAC